MCANFFFSAVVFRMNWFGTSLLAGHFFFKITHPPSPLQKKANSPALRELNFTKQYLVLLSVASARTLRFQII